MTVLTDVKLSSSAAHAIAERTRFVVMDRFPQEVLDVLVGNQTAYPLRIQYCIASHTG